MDESKKQFNKSILLWGAANYVVLGFVAWQLWYAESQEEMLKITLYYAAYAVVAGAILIGIVKKHKQKDE